MSRRCYKCEEFSRLSSAWPQDIGTRIWMKRHSRIDLHTSPCRSSGCHIARCRLSAMMSNYACYILSCMTEHSSRSFENLSNFFAFRWCEISTWTNKSINIHFFEHCKQIQDDSSLFQRCNRERCENKHYFFDGTSSIFERILTRVIWSSFGRVHCWSLLCIRKRS